MARAPGMNSAFPSILVSCYESCPLSQMRKLTHETLNHLLTATHGYFPGSQPPVCVYHADGLEEDWGGPTVRFQGVRDALHGPHFPERYQRFHHKKLGPEFLAPTFHFSKTKRQSLVGPSGRTSGRAHAGGRGAPAWMHAHLHACALTCTR